MNDGVYLRTRYEDPRRGEIREREYNQSGDVWVVVNGERSLWCRLDPEAVAAARRAIAEADLAAVDDIEASGPDLATMTYEWSLDETTGRLVDAAYPAVVPDEVDRLEDVLLSLEEGATQSES